MLAAMGGDPPAPPPPPPPPVPPRLLRTCRVCHARFDPAANHPTACRHHPALYTGGELAKAVGFVRASAAPEHGLKAVMGRTGILRFWDCCGAEDPAAPGCAAAPHVGYGE